MQARKWLSNSQKVLQKIPEEERAAEVDLNKGNLPSVKTLGILWLAKEDLFTYRVSPPSTKRNVSRKIATLFDPMGLLAPYVIRTRFFFKRFGRLNWIGMDFLTNAKPVKRRSDLRNSVSCQTYGFPAVCS